MRHADILRSVLLFALGFGTGLGAAIYKYRGDPARGVLELRDICLSSSQPTNWNWTVDDFESANDTLCKDARIKATGGTVVVVPKFSGRGYSIIIHGRSPGRDNADLRDQVHTLMEALRRARVRSGSDSSTAHDATP